jgi:Zn-dependent M28 family amino/carboxypeptidase
MVQWLYQEENKYGNGSIYNYTIQGVVCQNIIGKMNIGHTKIIVFATHFDSRAIAEKDSDYSKRNNPIMAANDGASGVGVLLEMQRVLAISNYNSDYEFWFIFFDAEDQGSGAMNGWNWCEGSDYMVQEMKNNPSKYFMGNQSIRSINAFFLLDMVGGTKLRYIYEQNSNSDLNKLVFSTGRLLGYETAFPTNPTSMSITDDHVGFAQQGVPTMDLIIEFWNTQTGWPYHHTTGDNIANIDVKSLEITGKTLLQLIFQNFISEYSSSISGSNIQWIPPINSSDPPIGVIIAIIGLLCIPILLAINIMRHKKLQNNYKKIH